MTQQNGDQVAFPLGGDERRYDLAGEGVQIQVTYTHLAEGPLNLSLSYQGLNGRNGIFSGNDIRSLDSELGTLLSVTQPNNAETLKPVKTTLSVFLPVVYPTDRSPAESPCRRSPRRRYLESFVIPRLSRQFRPPNTSWRCRRPRHRVACRPKPWSTPSTSARQPAGHAWPASQWQSRPSRPAPESRPDGRLPTASSRHWSRPWPWFPPRARGHPLQSARTRRRPPPT